MHSAREASPVRIIGTHINRVSNCAAYSPQAYQPKKYSDGYITFKPQTDHPAAPCHPQVSRKPPSRTLSPAYKDLRPDGGRVIKEVTYECVRTDEMRKLVDEKSFIEVLRKNELLRTEKENLEKIIEKLNEDSRQTSRSLERRSQSVVDDLNEKLNQTIQERDTIRRDMNGIEMELEHWKKRLDVKDRIVEEMQKANENLANEIFYLKDQFALVTEENSQLQVKLLKASQKSEEEDQQNEKDIDTIHQQLLELKEAIRLKDELVSRYEGIENNRKQVATLQSAELSRLNEENLQLKLTLDSTLNEKEALEATCSQMEEQITGVETLFEKEKREFINTAKNASGNLGSLMKTIGDLSEENKNRKKEAETLKRELLEKAAQVEHYHLVTSRHSLETSQLKSTIRDHQNKLKLKEDELYRVQEDLQQLLENNKKISSDLIEQESKMRKEENKILKLRGSLLKQEDELRRRNEDLVICIEVEKERSSRLNQEIITMKRDAARKDSEIDALKDQLDELAESKTQLIEKLQRGELVNKSIIQNMETIDKDTQLLKGMPLSRRRVSGLPEPAGHRKVEMQGDGERGVGAERQHGQTDQGDDEKPGAQF